MNSFNLNRFAQKTNNFALASLRFICLLVGSLAIFGAQAQADTRTITGAYTTALPAAAFNYNSNPPGVAQLVVVSSELRSRLTDDAVVKVGSIFTNRKFELGADRAFSAYFRAKITSSQNASGGDGLTFIIQGSSGTQASGELGYSNFSSNSLAIELDTSYSGSEDGESGSHIGVLVNGDTSAVAQVDVATMENAGALDVWVDYDGATLDVYFAQNTTTRPGSPSLSTAIDLSSVLPDDVYFGFGGSTGGVAHEANDIISFYFNTSAVTGSIAPAAHAYVSYASQVNGGADTLAPGADNTTEHTLEAVLQKVDSTGDVSALASQLITFEQLSGSSYVQLLATTDTTDSNGRAAVAFRAIAPGTSVIRAHAPGGAFDDITINAASIDTDSDGVADHLDNCPTVYNPNQKDQDSDEVGNACDSDYQHPRVTIDNVTQAEGNSGTSNFVFTVSLDRNAESAFDLNWVVNDGTAVAGTDYVDGSGTLHFAGTASETHTITVVVAGDTRVERDETFAVVLSSISAGDAVFGDDTGTGTISNDDTATLDINDVSHDEGNSGTTTYQFTVTLSNAVDTGVTVNWATANGTATTADTDYNSNSGSLVFFGTTGETRTLTVYGRGDTKYSNANETFQVLLSGLENNGRSGVSIGDGTGIGTLVNDDALPVVTLSRSPAIIDEDGGSATLTLTQDAVAEVNTTVNVSFSGNAARPADYTAAASVVISAGSTSNTIALASVDDNDIEVDEVATIDISSVTNGVESGTQRVSVTIDDDEAPLDYDSDGITNIGECESGVPCPDSDGDSTLDVNDTDSDNDGALDSAECPSGFPCPDEDSDGVSNQREASDLDTDGDGLRDQADSDDDGDDVPTSDECALGYSCADSDGDSIPDYLDKDDSGANAGDSDEDGLRDDVECDDGYRCTDSDGDLVPDYMDTDSDNDGELDGAETAAADTDSDGIPNRLESSVIDTDGDGLVDEEDANDDGDGSPTSVECASGVPCADVDGDDIPDYLDNDVNGPGTGDSDADGLSDEVECSGGYICADTDADQVPDYMDTDADNDGISDSIEGNVDTDSDGTPDYLDSDSDGDGINDLTEGSVDSDSDGTADFRDLDSDDDSISDAIEGSRDTDSDGHADFRDTDSDEDSINDNTEGAVDSDGDGDDNYVDTDSDDDGLLDSFEGDVDSDNDGSSDYRDVDSDNDGIRDSLEGQSDLDSDSDGTPNRIDTDSDNDGIADVVETAADSDGDGLGNYIDTDSDNDGISDAVEGSADADADGYSNATDTDSDADGIPDAVEGTADVDSDGKANYLDIDSDGDGIPDKIEAQATGAYRAANGLDSDADGLDDAFDTNSGGSVLPLIDTDGDGTADYLDSDSDADGVPDVIEGHDLDHNGAAELVVSGLDSNANGLDDAFESCTTPETISNLYRDPVQLSCIDVGGTASSVTLQMKRVRNQLGEYLLLRAKIAKACKLPTGHRADERSRHNAERIYQRILAQLATLPTTNFSSCQLGTCAAVDCIASKDNLRSDVRGLADIALDVLGGTCNKLGKSDRAIKRARTVVKGRRTTSLSAVDSYPDIPIICQRY